MREVPRSLAGLVLFVLWGCGDDASGGKSSTLGQGGSNGYGGTSSGNVGGGSSGETYPKPCSDLYDPNNVPQFELELAAADLAQLESDCEANNKVFLPAVFKYGGETVGAMVRLKGNWSWRCEKKQFLISFNETDANARFHGLRKLVLDAPWYDTTLIAERLGFAFMQRVGVPWSCANNATLSLNGAYYGVYANVERLDKEYLQRHFPGTEADGNLYDGGVELRTNETLNDVSRRDTLMSATSDLATIANMVDLDEAVKVWSASAMLPDPDSYWAGVEINYYLYDHPTRGFLWFPYDMDMTLLPGTPESGTSTVLINDVSPYVDADPFTYENPDWQREPLMQTVLSDAIWCNRFVEELTHARDAYDVALMTNQIDAWAVQVAEAVSTDPNKPFTNQDHLEGIAAMKASLPQRLAYVNSWLQTVRCPVTRWP